MGELEALGINKDELREMVVERAIQAIRYDDFNTNIEDKLQKGIDDKVSALFDEHVLPKVGEMIEEITLQKTNTWGEARGEKVTFIEYLVEQAAEHMNEMVDHSGKSKKHSDGYGWKGSQTRISHLVDKHLEFSIKNAMTEAMAKANSQIINGIEETVKMKLQEVADQLKVTVKTR